MRSHHAIPARGRPLPNLRLFGARAAPRRPAAPADAALRKQRVRDVLAVCAVLFLILTTAVVIISYVVHQAPAWRAGQMAGFAPTPAVLAAQEAAARNAASSSPASDVVNGLGRVPLILISTAVEMAIFVALGLYLRHDMDRKP